MDKQTQENIWSKLNDYNEILKIKVNKDFAWFRHILTISIGLLGILVSLKSKTNDNITQQILFIITICTLLLGILSGVIYLYSEIAIESLRLKKKKEYIKLLMEGKSKDVIESLDVNKGYNFCKILSLIMFLIALLCICTYSLISNIDFLNNSIL